MNSKIVISSEWSREISQYPSTPLELKYVELSLRPIASLRMTLKFCRSQRADKVWTVVASTIQESIIHRVR